MSDPATVSIFSALRFHGGPPLHQRRIPSPWHVENHRGHALPLQHAQRHPLAGDAPAALWRQDRQELQLPTGCPDHAPLAARSRRMERTGQRRGCLPISALFPSEAIRLSARGHSCALVRTITRNRTCRYCVRRFVLGQACGLRFRRLSAPPSRSGTTPWSEAARLSFPTCLPAWSLPATRPESSEPRKMAASSPSEPAVSIPG